MALITQDEIMLNHPFTTMMSSLKYADVIVVDSEHYAVAIKFDENIHKAPIVIARGINAIALEIKEIARTSGVHSVRNSALSQSLYCQVEGIGTLIPEEFYLQVAEILAYVYQLAKEEIT